MRWSSQSVRHQIYQQRPSESIGIDHVPGNNDLHTLVFIDNIKIFLP